VAVVLGHRRERRVGQLEAVERQAQVSVDAVGRVGVDPHRDDRPPQLPGAAAERDLLGRALQRRGAELGERLLVEREDEVRLRLDLAVEVRGQRALVERDPRAEQILLEHRLPRDVRVALHQRLDERRAGGSPVAHAVHGIGRGTWCPT
jgi:hypothetical protein